MAPKYYAYTNNRISVYKLKYHQPRLIYVESSWNVMAHGDARAEKWRGNQWMEWAASKRHMTAEHRLARAVQTPQADVHSTPASSRLNWRSRRFKWTRPFGRKTKCGFCACAITFQKQSTYHCVPPTMHFDTGNSKSVQWRGYWITAGQHIWPKIILWRLSWELLQQYWWEIMYGLLVCWGH